MEQLKTIKEQLVTQVQSQMNDLRCVDAEELGEVIDMIKDLSEAIYYCEIYNQMHSREDEEKKSDNYYTERYYPTRDMDRDYGRMYYSSHPGTGSNLSINGTNSSSTSSPAQSTGEAGRSYYTERDYPVHFRDEREGRSPIKRKMYMESKSSGQDKSKTIKELESYMQDLTSDMMEMLDKATPEEKTMVQKKINTLAAKIQNV